MEENRADGTVTFETLARHLPDELWKAFEPVLPPVIWCGNGRPPRDNRSCLHATIYVLASGIPWKMMPACFPSYKTVRKRFQQWLDCGAFLAVWMQCAERYELERGINFDQLSLDGARKAAKKGARQPAPTRPIAPNAARKSFS
jgi:transposase